MTSIILEDLVASRLEEIFKDLVLDSPRGSKEETQRNLKIYKGFFKPSRVGEKNENIPGIAVKACSGKENLLTINLDIYCYSEKEDGHRSGLLIIEKIRRNFYSKPVFEFAEFKNIEWDMLNMSGPVFEYGALLEFLMPEITKEDGELI